MKALKEKILNDGKAIGDEVIKVDAFLNHCIDTRFLEETCREFYERFKEYEVDRILTVEASGIAIACMTAPLFGYPPVVFAKKATPSTMTDGFYHAKARSFTKGTVSTLRVSKEFIKEREKILIIDDFLASGEAALALADIVEQAGGTVVGVGAVIEKGFQGGSEKLRKRGYKVESLAVIESIEDGRIFFEQA